MSTNEATALLNDSPLLKSDDGGHKYVKREGVSGAYKYTYADGSTGHTEHKPAAFSLAAQPHQQGLFGASSFEKKPKPKPVDPEAHRQTDMFAAKPAAAPAPAPAAPTPSPAKAAPAEEEEHPGLKKYREHRDLAEQASSRAGSPNAEGHHDADEHVTAAFLHRKAATSASDVGKDALARHHELAATDHSKAAKHAVNADSARKATNTAHEADDPVAGRLSGAVTGNDASFDLRGSSALMAAADDASHKHHLAAEARKTAGFNSGGHKASAQEHSSVADYAHAAGKAHGGSEWAAKHPTDRMAAITASEQHTDAAADARKLGPRGERLAKMHDDAAAAHGPAGAGPKQIERVSGKGGTVELHHRDGKVVGAVGDEPRKYMGSSIEDARHAVKHGSDPKAKAKKKSPKAAATHASHVADAAAAREGAADHAHEMGAKATQATVHANQLSNAKGSDSDHHAAAHAAHKVAATAHTLAAEAFQKPGAGVSIGGTSFSKLHEDSAKSHEEKSSDHWKDSVKARSDEQGEPFSAAATHKVGGEAKSHVDKLHEAVANLKPEKMTKQEHFEAAHAKVKALHAHLETKLGMHPASAQASKAAGHSDMARHLSGKPDGKKDARRYLSYAQEGAADAVAATPDHVKKAPTQGRIQEEAVKKSMSVEAGISRFQDRSAGRPAAGGVYDGLASGMVDPTVDRPRYAGRAPNQVIGVDVGVVNERSNTLAYQKGRQQGATLDLTKSAIIGAVKDGYRMQLMAVADANPVVALITRGRVEGERPTVPVELRKSVQLSAPDPDAVVAFAAAALKAASERSPDLKRGLSRLGVSRATLYATLEALALTPAGMTAGNR